MLLYRPDSNQNVISLHDNRYHASLWKIHNQDKALKIYESHYIDLLYQLFLKMTLCYNPKVLSIDLILLDKTVFKKHEKIKMSIKSKFIK